MNRNEAVALSERLVKIAKEKGQWVTVVSENRPNLTFIKIEVSIKVSNQNSTK